MMPVFGGIDLLVAALIALVAAWPRWMADGVERLVAWIDRHMPDTERRWW
jgi:hypothetical protein